ncbi:hypothetical protein OEZ86_006028 [Tetradesmus obliquus]|uniref:Dynein light chain n=1 Tax=Tetradesmus obliquus TaxID=3088 RepID=A0ABY8TWC5_TETOB|nr:hypothetical protein OEZ85_006339 [Tetradesmus obliquus]WIA32851.1 hypothetical protein OEZ86_006028 [Tetradesmus obliquus]
MADDVAAAAKQADPYACKEQHSCRVIDSLMPEAIEKHAVIVATAAVDKHKQLKDVAQFIKHEMDHKFPASKATEGVYHCAVGKSFASAISHEARQYIHIKVDTLHVVLWKSKDNPFHAQSS